MKKISLFRYNNSIDFDKYFFYFIIIDILFLPNFSFFVMPMSLPMLIVWYVFNSNKIKLDYDFKLFIVLTFFILLTTAISFNFTPKYINNYNVWGDNLKRPFQLCLSFLYFFYIKEKIKLENYPIKNILMLFLVFVDILALIYIIDVGLYFDIKTFFNVRDPFMNYWYTTTNDHFVRYSYLFVDPNSIGYISSCLSLFLILNCKTNLLEKLFILLSSLLILICCMSSGSIISLILGIISIPFLYLKYIRISFKFNYKKLLSIFLALSILIIFSLSIDNLFDIKLFDYSLNRIENNEANSRFTIYSNLISPEKIFKNLIIGDGYTLINSGAIKRPHSDHLRIIYGYGCVSYIIMILIMFRKRKYYPLFKHIFIIPAFICFSINTLIDEQKVLVIYLILLAYISDKRSELIE